MASRYIKKNLVNDEHVVLQAKKSYWFMFSYFFGLAFLAGFYYGVYLLLTKSVIHPWEELHQWAQGQYMWLAIIILAILAIPLLVLIIKFPIRFIGTIISQLVITNKRVVAKVGILSIRAIDYPIDKIESVYISAGMFGNMVHSHALVINGSGNSGAIYFKALSNAQKIKNHILSAIELHAEEARKIQAEEIAKAIVKLQAEEKVSVQNQTVESLKKPPFINVTPPVIRSNENGKTN